VIVVDFRIASTTTPAAKRPASSWPTAIGEKARMIVMLPERSLIACAVRES
jgi:hypothetical protein